MLFKKAVGGVLRITDVNPPFEIVHTYFKIKESEYPFDSLQFKKLLESSQVYVLSFEEGSKYKNILLKYMYVDKQLEETKVQQNEIHKKKQEEDEKKARIAIKTKHKEEKKKKQIKEKEELDKLKSVIIIKDEEIEENVAKHLLG